MKIETSQPKVNINRIKFCATGDFELAENAIFNLTFSEFCTKIEHVLVLVLLLLKELETNLFLRYSGGGAFNKKR